MRHILGNRKSRVPDHRGRVAGVGESLAKKHGYSHSCGGDDPVDADLLDGQHGSYYAAAAVLDAAVEDIETRKAGIIPITVDTAAATAAKTATVSGYTRRVGDMLAVKFTLGNTVASMTLNLTDDTGALGAANILFNAAATNTTTATLTANSITMLYWDGTSYHMLGSQRTSDSDTYDQVRWSGGAKNGTDHLYSYKLCGMDSGGLVYPFTLETGTGTNKTVSSQQFLLDGPILGYGATTGVSAGSTSFYLYSERNFDIRYTSNGTFTAWLPIYLKVTLVDERTYQLAGAGTVGGTSFLTQSLPTSDDGYLYIFLGYMYAAATMRLVGAHPIYEYKNGGVRLYVPNSTFAAMEAQFNGTNESLTSLTVFKDKTLGYPGTVGAPSVSNNFVDFHWLRNNGYVDQYYIDGTKKGSNRFFPYLAGEIRGNVCMHGGNIFQLPPTLAEYQERPDQAASYQMVRESFIPSAMYRVKSVTLTTPPAGAYEGDRYISPLNGEATGDWENYNGYMHTKNGDGTWTHTWPSYSLIFCGDDMYYFVWSSGSLVSIGKNVIADLSGYRKVVNSESDWALGTGNADHASTPGAIQCEGAPMYYNYIDKASKQYFSRAATPFDVPSGNKKFYIRGWLHWPSDLSHSGIASRTPGGQGDWSIIVTSSSILFRLNGTAYECNLARTSGQYVGEDFYLECCYDGTQSNYNMQIFINGVLKARTGTVTADPTNTANSMLNLGYYYNSDYSATQRMWDWAIKVGDAGHWNSSSVGTTVYTPPARGTAPTDSPTAFWKFNDGSGTTAADSSGNGYSLSNTNGSAWTNTSTFNSSTWYLDWEADPDASVNFDTIAAQFVVPSGCSVEFRTSTASTLSGLSSATPTSYVSMLSGVAYQVMSDAGKYIRLALRLTPSGATTPEVHELVTTGKSV